MEPMPGQSHPATRGDIHAHRIKLMEVVMVMGTDKSAISLQLFNQLRSVEPKPDSGQSTHFTAEVMQEIWKLLGIKVKFHISYHPI